MEEESEEEDNLDAEITKFMGDQTLSILENCERDCQVSGEPSYHF